MKSRIFILFFLMPVMALAQQQPVSWKLRSERNSSSHYTIYIESKIQDGWHVYANGDDSFGLEALTISWDNENIAETKAQATANSSNGKTLEYKDPLFDNKALKVYKGEVLLKKIIVIQGSIPASFTVRITGYASNDEEFISIGEQIPVLLEGGADAANHIKLSTIDLANPVENCGDNQSEEKGLLTIFLLGLAGGLFALITPCVFPMVPVTVSFFMNRSKTKRQSVRNGLLYGLFIFLVYLIASVPFHLVNGIDKNIFNSIATNSWVNVFFFLVFIIFALSFFGLFEITLPSGLATKADARSNAGSIAGIFFMALTLAIVSFSCTGVILGILLANVAASGPWALTMGMGAFGLALALPFALFAMFPKLLKTLPKSGSWLDTTKKALAFVELALAFKFLSNADLVEHWGLLKREVFIAIWILISLGLALYLLGVFDKKKIVVQGMQNADRLEPVKPKLSRTRIAFGLTILFFTLYLTPGLTQSKYANLKLLSGFPPPLSYSIYGTNNVRGKGIEPTVINDYEAAVILAKKENKPILIDFTGWACVNCRKMEEQVWTKSDIGKLITEKYILVSLYVDDREKLSSDERFHYKTNEGDEREIKTVGAKWAAFQAENFNQVTQPLYVVLSPDEKLLNHPVGYTPDAEEYKSWLECGIQAYQKDKGISKR